MDPLRDRMFGLVSDLCGQENPLSPDGLRLLSHTLLGVAQDDGPRSLFAVRDAIPWLVAFLEANDGASPDTLSQILVSNGALKTLTPAFVVRRIRAAASRPPTVGNLTPSGSTTRLSNTLRELAELDRRLVNLRLQSDTVLRATLFGDAKLLAAVAELVVDPHAGEVAERFADALVVVPDEESQVALSALSELESTWDGAALRLRADLSERSTRFAISTTDHLREYGFSRAVRAALAYRGTIPELVSDAVFADNPPLGRLAEALVSVRGFALERTRDGAGPDDEWGAASRWVHYLVANSDELARSHDCMVREAQSFAHFALHLVNFCDMFAESDAGDGRRNRLMEVENDLRSLAEHRSVASGGYTELRAGL